MLVNQKKRNLKKGDICTAQSITEFKNDLRKALEGKYFKKKKKNLRLNYVEIDQVCDVQIFFNVYYSVMILRVSIINKKKMAKRKVKGTCIFSNTRMGKIMLFHCSIKFRNCMTGL